jgi:hypothetical protein
MGACIGGFVYGVTRLFLPVHVVAGTVMVGILAGLGARLAGAAGTRTELRVLVFSSVIATVGGEFAAYARRETADLDLFTAFLFSHPWLTLFAVVFLTFGIFVGARLIFEDALRSVLDAAALDPDRLRAAWSRKDRVEAAGRPCPRCGSLQTVPEKGRRMLECTQCGLVFSPDREIPQDQGQDEG